MVRTQGGWPRQALGINKQCEPQSPNPNTPEADAGKEGQHFDSHSHQPEMCERDFQEKGSLESSYQV